MATKDHKFQLLHNKATQEVLDAQRSTQGTRLLWELYCLSVLFWVQSKMVIVTFKCFMVHDWASRNHLLPVISACPLRSESEIVPVGFHGLWDNFCHTWWLNVNMDCGCFSETWWFILKYSYVFNFITICITQRHIWLKHHVSQVQ